MKFFNLLKKELAELINTQMIVSLIAVVALFMVMGNIMTTTVEEAVKSEYTINISDRDNTEFTAKLFDTLSGGGAKVNVINTEGDDYAQILEDAGKSAMVIIPEGFTAAIENGEAPELISVASMKSSAMMSNLSNSNSGALEFISNCISDTFAEMSGLTPEDVALINSPVTVMENTVVNGKSAAIDTDTIMNKISMQSMILPIVVFVLIMMTSQMLMSAIANEKIDKTLETLLSAPVSRTAILGSKMLAAAIVALLNAVCYMFAFSKFMSGAEGSISDDMAGMAVTDFLPVDKAMEQLGLTLGIGDYILVGVQLFVTIMICLSVSLILGSLISDTKQAQTMIMPLMFMALIPYIISMFADVNSLPMALRIVVYAIPFTHTFSAIPNLSFGNTAVFFGGLAYQIVVLAVCLFFALRLFKSDKILTASFNFGQKSRFRRKKSAAEEE
ncbi:MAG: ABC transporter permease [Ruminococcus sp.]|nr:ABC transporter permease [Ruminococcus sp.]